MSNSLGSKGRKDSTLVGSPLLTSEEVEALLDKPEALLTDLLSVETPVECKINTLSALFSDTAYQGDLVGLSEVRLPPKEETGRIYISSDDAEGRCVSYKWENIFKLLDVALVPVLDPDSKKVAFVKLGDLLDLREEVPRGRS